MPPKGGASIKNSDELTKNPVGYLLVHSPKGFGGFAISISEKIQGFSQVSKDEIHSLKECERKNAKTQKSLFGKVHWTL